MLLDIIAGARPNFMKISPIIAAIRKAASDGHDVSYRLIHTGQHYDKNMSDQFFEQLGIPLPDINLGVGSGTQAEQTAAIMIGYEKVIMERRPDLTIVVGDVTSTMACAISAKKLHVKVAHVEAGIRSGDITMPEEVNRLVTDSITDYFFTTSSYANENLERAGVQQERIFFVGNTMIDTLMANLDRLRKPAFWDQYGMESGKYLVMTLHRPSNVDDKDNLLSIIQTVMELAGEHKIVFPVHPRTRKNLDQTGFSDERLILTEPMGYLEFIYMVKNAKAVITDSGGITEEATVLGIPCMTMRNSTERPETCVVGTNELIGTDPKALIPAIEKLMSGNWKKGTIPEMWDGKAAERIINAFVTTLKPEPVYD